MADYTFGVHADLNFQQIKQAVVHVLTAHPASPVSGQIWYRSDLSNGTGNGVLYMRDASGNNIAVGTGSGSGLTDAYTAITDGTTTTTTSGGETLQFIPSGTGLSVAVVNGNVGFGGRDTVTYTLNSATSGANKVLLLDGSGGIAHGSYVILGAGSSDGRQDWVGVAPKRRSAKGRGSTPPCSTRTATSQCDGTITFHGGVFLTGGASGTIAGSFGYSSGLLSYGDGTSQLVVVNTTSSQTISNKTLGTDLAAGSFKITGLAAGVSGSDAVNLTQLTAVQQGRGPSKIPSHALRPATSRSAASRRSTGTRPCRATASSPARRRRRRPAASTSPAPARGRAPLTPTRRPRSRPAPRSSC
jgi:hypothetical protein